MLYLARISRRKCSRCRSRSGPKCSFPIASTRPPIMGSSVGFSAPPALSGRLARTDGGFYPAVASARSATSPGRRPPRFRTGVGFNLQEIDLPIPGGSSRRASINTTFDIVFSSRFMDEPDPVRQRLARSGTQPAPELDPRSRPGALFRRQSQLQDFDGATASISLTSDLVGEGELHVRV